MPASEFAQKQVGIMAGITDVVKDCCPTQFAGVIDDDIAKTKDSLGNTGGNCNVLNLAEWNIASGAGDQTGINLDFRVGQSVADHVSPQVVKSGNQQERQRQRYRDIGWHRYQGQQENEANGPNHRQRVSEFNENQSGPHGEYCLLEIFRLARALGHAPLRARDPGCFRIVCRRTATRAKTHAGSYICTTVGTMHSD